MSAIRYQDAGEIDHTPDAKVEAGAVVVVGGIVGVATREIAAGKLGALATDGVWKLDLASGKTFEDGDPVYVSNSEATDSGTFFGWAVGDSDATSGTVKAMLVQTSVEES